MGIGVKNNTNHSLAIRYSIGIAYYSQNIEPEELMYWNVGAVWMTVECNNKNNPDDIRYQIKKEGCYGGCSGTWLKI